MAQQLVQIAQSLQQILIEAAPQVILGLVACVLLIALAKAAEWVLRAVLQRVKFDARLEQIGAQQTLHRLGIRQSMTAVLPRLAYFGLLLLFARTAADAFGLAAISDAIAALFAYLPNVVAAILLVVVGSQVSQFAGTAVRRAAEDAGIEFARTLGTVTSAFLLFIFGVMAFGQLKFDTDMVRIVTTCVLSGFALAFGLSIGLGTRDITRSVLAGFYARKVYEPGDPLEVRGQRGTLRAITSTQTIIEQETGIITVSNTVFLDDVVRH
ncbi:MAG: mechanosensitive ion channel [Acidobacteria bacterium]|nr:mechanosensitive ion channel [Acidobacteriota bacterium]